MTRDEVAALFLEMEKEVERAVQKWLRWKSPAFRETDVIHDVLVKVMEAAGALADTERARTEILAIANQVAFLEFQRRRAQKRRFRPPKEWVKDGRHLVLPTEEGGIEPSVDNLPDDRPNPEEEVVCKEAEEGIAALARRIGQDPTWRGELYRLIYVEGRSLVAAARILGITESAAKKRAERLRQYLRGTREGKRVVKQ